MAPSTSEVTRAGRRIASSSAITPPIETPKTWALSTPAASITARASAASSPIVVLRLVPLSPVPRLSKAIVRCSAASAGSVGYHICEL